MFLIVVSESRAVLALLKFCHKRIFPLFGGKMGVILSMLMQVILKVLIDQLQNWVFNNKN